nr:uncharacterized protein LOC123766951 [Procambarus clarkii]
MGVFSLAIVALFLVRFGQEGQEQTGDAATPTMPHAAPNMMMAFKHCIMTQQHEYYISEGKMGKGGCEWVVCKETQKREKEDIYYLEQQQQQQQRRLLAEIRKRSGDIIQRHLRWLQQCCARGCCSSVVREGVAAVLCERVLQQCCARGCCSSVVREGVAAVLCERVLQQCCARGCCSSVVREGVAAVLCERVLQQCCARGCCSSVVREGVAAVDSVHILQEAPSVYKTAATLPSSPTDALDTDMASGKSKLLLLLMTGATLGVTCATPAPAQPPRSKPQQPHIILIVADDVGWNDVSWHNPLVETPQLEALARSGVVLEQSYVQHLCSPTRSALLTGRYPFTIGRQVGSGVNRWVQG